MLSTPPYRFTFRKPFWRLAALIILATWAAVVLAQAGGTSDCGVDPLSKQVVAWGTPAEIEVHVSKYVENKFERLDRKERDVLARNPTALKAWQDEQRTKMLLGNVPHVYGCGGYYALDYAVANGNLDVVRWLLDLGVNPNAPSWPSGPSSIFTRCQLMEPTRNRPDGLSPIEVSERQLDAYRMLLARGAKMIDPDPFDSIRGCIKPEMHPVLVKLGGYVTDKSLWSWFYSSRGLGAFEFLATSRSFDLRGTAFEYEALGSLIARNPDTPDYKKNIEQARRLAKAVRLSPGLFPGEPAAPADVPGKFSEIRDRCYFPEFSAYPDFELAVLIRTQNSGEKRDISGDITTVSVSPTKQPIILALVNDRPTPTTWNIRRATGAHILGVIILEMRYSHEPHDKLSFDPLRPAFFGAPFHCDVDNVALKKEKRIILSQPLQTVDYPRKFSPFRLRPDAPVIVSDGNLFEIGNKSPYSAWTDWPNSIRRMDEKRLYGKTY